jgi:Holliday junction resolvase RusA-like endonuclease
VAVRKEEKIQVGKRRMKFTLFEVPTAQKRHRTFRRNGKNINYDPLSKEKYSLKLKMSKIMMHERMVDESVNNLPYKDYYHVSFMFTFPIPKSTPKALKIEMMEGRVKHTNQIDLDNIEKYFLDSMTGVFFSDDKKVVKLQSEKRWGSEGRIDVEINGFNHEIKNV